MQLDQVIHDSIGTGLKELDTVWEYIGYEDDQRALKLQTLADSMQRCVYDFISAENRHRVELDSRVESLKRKAAQVCQSLRLPPYFPPRCLPSLQLLRHIEEHIAQYEVEVVARQRKFSQLREAILSLCSRLGLEAESEMKELPDSGPQLDEFVPSEQDLDKLSAKFNQLQARHDELMKQFVSFCEDIRRIATDIEYQPESDLESSVLLRSQQNNNNNNSWPLTESSLQSLQTWRLRLVKHKAMLVGTCDELRDQVASLRRRLRLDAKESEQFLTRHRGYRPTDLVALKDELSRLQELRRGPMSAAYARHLRQEAEELANLCFEDGEDSTNGNGELDQLELLVDQLRDRYEGSRELYDTVRLYQQTWEAYMEVEQRMKDPAIFSNRGGILLKTEKEKKQLVKELPRVEARVAEHLRSCPGGEAFTIRGVTFQLYAQRLWDEFRGEKEAAKINRRSSARPGAVSASASSQDLAATLQAGPAGLPRKSLAPSASAVVGGLASMTLSKRQ